MSPVIARFQFKQDRAHEFCFGKSLFAEQEFDDVQDVIAFCEEFGDALVDVIANVNGRIICLSEQPEEDDDSNESD